MLNGIIQKWKLNGRHLYACFVDFKSAFDSVNRSALLFWLYSNGVQGKFLQTSKSMFQNAWSRVKWGGKIGELFENGYGALQGGVLSPTLFELFLDDMTGYLNRNNGVGIGNIKIPLMRGWPNFAIRISVWIAEPDKRSWKVLFAMTYAG